MALKLNDLNVYGDFTLLSGQKACFLCIYGLFTQLDLFLKFFDNYFSTFHGGPEIPQSTLGLFACSTGNSRAIHRILMKSRTLLASMEDRRFPTVDYICRRAVVFHSQSSEIAFSSLFSLFPSFSTTFLYCISLSSLITQKFNVAHRGRSKEPPKGSHLPWPHSPTKKDLSDRVQTP